MGTADGRCVLHVTAQPAIGRVADEFHQQDFLRRIDARKLTLSFSYAFGKPPRMRQAASEEMDMGIR